MRIDIVTVFPEMVAPALEHSIIKRARDRGLVRIQVVNLRDFTADRHKTTDDVPYGGGGGMIMKIEPIARALEALLRPSPLTPPSRGVEAGTEEGAAAHFLAPAIDSKRADVVEFPDSVLPGVGDAEPLSGIDPPSAAPRVLLTDPRGQRFTQAAARRWAREPHLIILCGHYEGVDERVRQHLVTDEVSVGDYILTGGELPALLITDALTRLQPGALGDALAPEQDTFAGDLLEYPHYTRPREFAGWQVPDILLSGHHAQIVKWRRWHQLRATRERRPDLFARLQLSEEDRKLMDGEEPAPPANPKQNKLSST